MIIRTYSGQTKVTDSACKDFCEFVRVLWFHYLSKATARFADRGGALSSLQLPCRLLHPDMVHDIGSQSVDVDGLFVLRAHTVVFVADAGAGTAVVSHGSNPVWQCTRASRGTLQAKPPLALRPRARQPAFVQQFEHALITPSAVRCSPRRPEVDAKTITTSFRLCGMACASTCRSRSRRSIRRKSRSRKRMASQQPG